MTQLATRFFTHLHIMKRGCRGNVHEERLFDKLQPARPTTIQLKSLHLITGMFFICLQQIIGTRFQPTTMRLYHCERLPSFTITRQRGKKFVVSYNFSAERAQLKSVAKIKIGFRRDEIVCRSRKLMDLFILLLIPSVFG
jgi:hypothetical protein